MSPNFITNVRLSFIKTRQALQFTHSALNIYQQLFPADPIKIASYNDAFANLTSASNAFISAPFDVHYPSDPILPPNPIFPPNVNNDVIIKLAQNRTLLAISRTNDAIKYINTAISLTDSDAIASLLIGIRAFQEDALVALEDALPLPIEDE
ncbi:hypothetical protein V7182_21655 [Neobacillus drentensis]|uniref:hypothetical protein n=1 Tax=Neobacillus drentensis TaxID=220684 RepID=UPI0030000799